MGFKRKQKELTPDEALKLAIQEETPFWMGTPPLFLGMSPEQGSNIYPLHESFNKKTWMILLVDPVDFSNESALDYICEWNRRFSTYNIETLLVLQASYSPWLQKRTLQRYIEKYKIKMPLALDRRQHIAIGFNLKTFPKFIFMDQGKILFEGEGDNFFSGVEQNIHDFLRKKEPGLPLDPVFISKLSQPKLLERWDLGSAGDVKWINKETLIKEAQKKEQEWKSLLSPGQVVFSGEWKVESDCVWTKDSKAELSFYISQPALSVLAQCHTAGNEMSKTLVFVEESPVNDVFAGNDISYDERGNSFLELRTLQLRKLFSNHLKHEREVNLRFPFAKQTPAAIFGLRFSGGL